MLTSFFHFYDPLEFLPFCYPVAANAPSPYLPSTPGGQPMTPNSASYLPGTPGGQPMTPGTGGLDMMSPVIGMRLSFSILNQYEVTVLIRTLISPVVNW